MAHVISFSIKGQATVEADTMNEAIENFGTFLEDLDLTETEDNDLGVTVVEIEEATVEEA